MYTNEELSKFVEDCISNGAMAVTIMDNKPSPWTPIGMDDVVYIQCINRLKAAHEKNNATNKEE